jgi:hypothetical protein
MSRFAVSQGICDGIRGVALPRLGGANVLTCESCGSGNLAMGRPLYAARARCVCGDMRTRVSCCRI